MNVQIKVDTDKLNRTVEALKRLPDDFDRDQVMMKVFRKAARPMINRGKAEAALSIPNVAKGFSWGSRKSRDGTVMRVGVVNKSKTTGRLAYIFEKGNETPRETSAGLNRGSIRAHGYWERAVSSTEGEVVKLVNRNVDMEINKYLEKYSL